MERPSEKKVTGESLQQQYRNLEEEWESIKQPKQRTTSRSLTDSRTIVKGLYFLDSSPRKLMSSLQHRRSPSGAWKLRTNDLAVAEIVRERQAAIESGRAKGRRLFDTFEGESEVGPEGIQEVIGSDNFDGLVQEISEVRSVCSYNSDDEKENIVESKEESLHPVRWSSLLSSTSSSSYVCDECMEKEIVAEEGENPAAPVAMEATSDEEKKRSANGVKRWRRIVLVVLCAIAIISVRSLAGNYRDGNKVILVPT